MFYLFIVSVFLRILLEKNIVWYWDEEKEISFFKFKNMVINVFIFQYYDLSKFFIFSVDVSLKGLGVVFI